MDVNFKANVVAIGGYFLRLLLVLFCILLVLAPYSLLVGWNLLTFFLFWLIILPVLTIYLSSKLFRNKSGIVNATGALIFFYSFMIFMTYKHFESDYFSTMMISAMWNLLIMTVVWLTERDGRRARESHPG